MKFLLCSLDGNGFIYPAIGIARTLIDRGHDTAFVADSKHAGLLERLGVNRIPRSFNQDGHSFNTNGWDRPWSIAMQVKHAEHAISTFDPDVIIGQALTLGPILAGERCRIPVALLGMSLSLWPHWEEAEDAFHQTARERRQVKRYEVVSTAYNDARKLFGMSPSPTLRSKSPLYGDLFMLQSIPDLVPEAYLLPPVVKLVGSCVWEPPDETDSELERWLTETTRRGNPIVYVHHGRYFDLPSFWRILMNVLQSLGCCVAASIMDLDPESLEIPSGALVRPHVSQTAVLSHARLVVTTGNTTAFLGALTAGVPMLVLPGGGEQPDIAEVAVGSGVARMLQLDQTDHSSVLESIGYLLSEPSYTERAIFLSEVFSKWKGAERVSSLTEHLATEFRSRGYQFFHDGRSASNAERIGGFALERLAKPPFDKI
jgi:UDP:flavonoid glycosyltransferase YjiC (YdhE family)